MLRIKTYFKQEFGEISFGMSYLPTAQRLSFSISKAANLKWQEVAEELDQFSESCFYSDDQTCDDSRGACDHLRVHMAMTPVYVCRKDTCVWHPVASWMCVQVRENPRMEEHLITA